MACVNGKVKAIFRRVLMDDDEFLKHDSENYEVGETALTIDELVQQYRNVSKLAKEMNLLLPYMMADIAYRESRSKLYKKLSDFLTGTIIIGAVGKLGAIVIGLAAPFIIKKIKIFLLGL